MYSSEVSPVDVNAISHYATALVRALDADIKSHAGSLFFLFLVVGSCFRTILASLFTTKYILDSALHKMATHEIEIGQHIRTLLK